MKQSQSDQVSYRCKCSCIINPYDKSNSLFINVNKNIWYLYRVDELPHGKFVVLTNGEKFINISDICFKWHFEEIKEDKHDKVL